MYGMNNWGQEIKNMEIYSKIKLNENKKKEFSLKELVDIVESCQEWYDEDGEDVFRIETINLLSKLLDSFKDDISQ